MSIKLKQKTKINFKERIIVESGKIQIGVFEVFVKCLTGGSDTNMAFIF